MRLEARSPKVTGFFYVFILYTAVELFRSFNQKKGAVQMSGRQLCF